MNKSKWNADAEAVMMGFVVPVSSDEHGKYMLRYILKTLRCYPDVIVPQDDAGTDERVKEIWRNINQYNDNPVFVSHMCIQTTSVGIVLTLVRDEQVNSGVIPLTCDDGVMAWVENLSDSWSSELGYVWFAVENNKLRRIG